MSTNQNQSFWTTTKIVAVLGAVLVGLIIGLGYSLLNEPATVSPGLLSDVENGQTRQQVETKIGTGASADLPDDAPDGVECRSYIPTAQLETRVFVCYQDNKVVLVNWQGK